MSFSNDFEMVVTRVLELGPVYRRHFRIQQISANFRQLINIFRREHSLNKPQRKNSFKKFIQKIFNQFD
jgi:hypothetical protein